MLNGCHNCFYHFCGICHVSEGGLQEGGLQEAGVEVLHLLLTHLPHLSEETRDTFTQTLQRGTLLPSP